MARKPLKYRGATCSKDCSGTRAGFAYGMGGGRKPNRKAPSFSRGLRIAVKAMKARTRRRKRR
jgi:hypothetical protein